MSSDETWPFASGEDRALAEALGRGEADAFATVRRWVRAAAGPYRPAIGADLEDLEQEIILTLLDALREGRFEGRSRLATYEKKAVVYRCLNRIRDRRKRVFVPPEDVRLECRSPDPYREAADRDELERALRVLAGMSETCREIWCLIAAGLSYTEMSARLGVAVGTLRVRALRCRQRALELWDGATGSGR
jgi:RNA polymerase sigma-70 factor (ECF subfamily)